MEMVRATSAKPAPATAGPGLLRFLTCGSVDDGKSTLIGRLLYDLGQVPSDQLASLERDARASGREVDLAFLLDGLEAEQEQGITIDVAYRYFRSPRRSFIVADSPGHEQYTRNMATGASVSDLAILLIDARKGVLTQTRRHALIVSHFGTRHVVLAVNKLDLMNYSQEVFERIEKEFRDFARDLGFRSITAIPVSALKGDNLVHRSKETSWFKGPTLIERLDTVDIESEQDAAAFRMPVQWVCRPNLDFRGLAGTIRGGTLKVGDPVMAAGSQKSTTVARILCGETNFETASAGDAVMVTFRDEIDASRGDVLCHPQSAPTVADQVAANILWLSDAPMIPGRSYLMKIGARKIPAEVTALKYRIDVNSGAHIAAAALGANEIGFANLAFSSPIAIDSFAENRDTGSFILIDRMTNGTIGAGMIAFSLRRASNIHPQKLEVDQATRAALKHHKPAVLWFTGLSGAGKSTIASHVERQLAERGVHTYVLDGDNLRGGLNRDLGFTEADRVENVRRTTEVAKLFADAGIVVLVSLISPYRAERLAARERIGEDFIEVFVDTPIELCRQRDPKGLYAKADRGEIKNFTGIDAPYEAPERPEIRLQTANADSEALADEVVKFLRSRRVLE
jgi:bifunctional enzyme CysN/CysC